jgi:hypothetical protein
VLLRIGIGRTGHGGIDAILRGKLFDARSMCSNHPMPVSLTTVTILILLVFGSFRWA